MCRLDWRYNGEKLSFSWPYMLISVMWNNSELSASHLICATAIFGVDCCQFGPSWSFGLKMELMACVTWLAVQRSKDVFFLTLYDSINNMKHFWTVCITPQPCHSHFVVDCCQFGPSWFLVWKWSLWHVPTWLAAQRSKAVFFMNLYYIINDIKHFLTVWITPQPCHSHVYCWLLSILS